MVGVVFPLAYMHVELTCYVSSSKLPKPAVIRPPHPVWWKTVDEGVEEREEDVSLQFCPLRHRTTNDRRGRSRERCFEKE